MRLQIIVDDTLGQELQAKAHDLGLSVSSYVRYILKRSASKPNMVDIAMAEASEKISLEDLKKQIQELM